MIGDVNLFLKGSPTDEDFEVESGIMIAGPLRPITWTLIARCLFVISLRTDIPTKRHGVRSSSTDVLVRLLDE